MEEMHTSQIFRAIMYSVPQSDSSSCSSSSSEEEENEDDSKEENGKEEKGSDEDNGGGGSKEEINEVRTLNTLINSYSLCACFCTYTNKNIKRVMF